MPTHVQPPAIAPFDNSYARLEGAFFARQQPQPAPAPHLIRLNTPLAESLGFAPDALEDEDWAAIFAGNVLPEGSDPLAMAYAGHQFGNFVPQLGDGRALLLGEVVDGDGIRRDIQLKGSGRTPFSLRGDGRSALGPVLREYLVSEAMHALGVPTTRSLAAVTTGEHVFRQMPHPGGVFTRVAQSHVRVGTFEYFAARGETAAVRDLADYVIWRHYPDLAGSAEPYAELLRAVCERQASLVSQWLGVGFIHGVMNTDNMSIAGETLDYGPCAFMDHYDPETVFSSIDVRGRYRYDNQLRIAQWNLARFAETLLPLLNEDREKAIKQATEIVEAFWDRAEACWLAVMQRKLGLQQSRSGDRELIQQWLTLMHNAQADFTLTFRRLVAAATADEPRQPLSELLGDSPNLANWTMAWRQRLADETVSSEAVSERLRRANPAIIPRNHQVERALTAAVTNSDFDPFHTLLARVTQPFESGGESRPEARPPAPEERVLQTFCGT